MWREGRKDKGQEKGWRDLWMEAEEQMDGGCRIEKRRRSKDRRGWRWGWRSVGEGASED